jgi:hypothetical protein
VPRTIIHQVPHKKLHLFACKMQITQELKPDYKPQRLDFAVDILHSIGVYLLPSKHLAFWRSYFQSDGKVSRYNTRVWGPENVIRYGLIHRFIELLLFVEVIAMCGVYSETLEQFVYSQVADLQRNIIYQYGGAPPHCSLHVRETLMKNLPDRWVGSDEPTAWPSRSPDITVLYLLLW